MAVYCWFDPLPLPPPPLLLLVLLPLPPPPLLLLLPSPSCYTCWPLLPPVSLATETHGHNALQPAGRPGVGKTTAIRELSRMLADECQRRVVVVVRFQTARIGACCCCPSFTLCGAQDMFQNLAVRMPAQPVPRLMPS